MNACIFFCWGSRHVLCVAGNTARAVSMMRGAHYGRISSPLTFKRICSINVVSCLLDKQVYKFYLLMITRHLRVQELFQVCKR